MDLATNAALIERPALEGRGRSLPGPGYRTTVTEPAGVAVPAVTGWHAVFTRSNCEQLVSSQLSAKNLTTFLPMATVWAHRGREPRRVQVPLFPGYLFVSQPIDKDRYVEVLKARGVVRILGERWDRLEPICAEEIEAIRRLTTSNQPILPHAHLRVGARVRVTGGPLLGVEGLLVRDRADKGLLVVSVNLLRRSVAVEVDCALVEGV